jgi:hypothetical protein
MMKMKRQRAARRDQPASRVTNRRIPRDSVVRANRVSSPVVSSPDARFRSPKADDEEDDDDDVGRTRARLANRVRLFASAGNYRQNTNHAALRTPAKETAGSAGSGATETLCRLSAVLQIAHLAHFPAAAFSVLCGFDGFS